MKYLLILLVVFCQTDGFAQPTEYPIKTHANFELSKPVKYVKIATYKADENGWEPVMAEVTSFNENNQLIQEYMRIMGEFASETAHNYVYDGQLLDSLNTIASASNFNVKSSFEPDENGRISTETAKGFYVDYTRKYTYNEDGTVKTITTDHARGTHNWTQFSYMNGEQDLVIQIDGRNFEEDTKNYFLYNKGRLFAKWNDDDNDLYLYPTDNRHFRLENHSQPLAAATELRKLQNTDQIAYDAKILEIAKEGEIVRELAISFNEQHDWTMKMVKTINEGQAEKRFVFREIFYADGTTSGSSDFDRFFYSRMKDL